MDRPNQRCHGCRESGHWLQDCPNKRRCPRCGKGFMRWLQVSRTKNVGKLFFNCTNSCGYFDWDDGKGFPINAVGESSGSEISVGETSGGQSKEVTSNDHAEEDATKALSHLLKMLATITEDKNLKLSLTLTLEKGKGREDEDEEENEKGKGKGKGKAKMV